MRKSLVFDAAELSSSTQLLTSNRGAFHDALCPLWVKSYRQLHFRSMSGAGGEPDVIGPNADIDNHTTTLSHISPPRRRAGAARRDLGPGDSPATGGKIALLGLLSGVHGHVVLPRFSGELFAHSRPAISKWTGLW